MASDKKVKELLENELFDKPKEFLDEWVARVKESKIRKVVSEPLQIGGNNYVVLLLLQKFGKSKAIFIDKIMNLNWNEVYYRRMIKDKLIERTTESDGKYYSLTQEGFMMIEVIRAKLPSQDELDVSVKNLENEKNGEKMIFPDETINDIFLRIKKILDAERFVFLTVK